MDPIQQQNERFDQLLHAVRSTGFHSCNVTCLARNPPSRRRSRISRLGMVSHAWSDDHPRFSAGKDYLQFEVPASLTKQKINKVKVTLTPDDTYTVTFLKWSRAKLEMTTLATRENVYVDNLREVFTSETGLETSL